MKPHIIECKPDIIKLSFKEIDQGFMSVIRDKLWENNATELAGFKVTHPESGELVFTLRTKGKKAKDVWNGALASLSKDLKKFAGLL